MKKTLKGALSAFLICLTISLIIACNSKPKWTWKANPYACDNYTQSIINSNAHEVLCTDIDFQDFVAFHKDNIAELVYNIELVKRYINKSNLSKKNKSNLNKMLDTLLIKK